MYVRHRQIARPDLFKNNFYGDLPITLYVDSVSGSDGNSGLTFALAKASIDNARSTIVSSYGGKGKIFVNAPSTTPASGFIDFSSGDIEISGYQNQTWYLERSTTYTTGWTSDGSGIYHRAHGGADTALLYVTSQTDSDGFIRRLTKNTSTPTTPNAGEFGRDVTNFYVKLIDSSDPNTHTIKRPSTSYLIRVSSSARLKMSNCYARYGSDVIWECTGSNAYLELHNCTGLFSAGAGVSIPTSGGRVNCYNCVMQKHDNDGYNIRANRMDLINCDGSYNYDEGASPHNSGIMNIIGGRYHHNQHGGLTAIDTSNMNINGVICENNGLDAQAGIEANGINYANSASGQIIDTISRNNNRSGFYCANTGVVTFNNFTSGIAQGNLEADVLC